MANIFYLYEHWRPDTNTCFYVGKGKDKRAWTPERRAKMAAFTAEMNRARMKIKE